MDNIKKKLRQKKIITYNQLTGWLVIIMFLFLPFLFFPNTLELHFVAKKALFYIIVFNLLIISVIQILKGKRNFFRTPLDIWFAIFFLLTIISGINAINKTEFYGSVQYIFFLIALYYVTTYSFPKEKLNTIITVLIHSASIISIIAIFQALNANDFTLQETVTATFGHSNLLAQYLIAIFPLSLCRSMEARKKYSAIYLIQTPVIFSAIMLTYCRGAWIGALSSIVFVCILILTSTETKKYFSIGSFLLIATGLFLISIPIILQNTGVIKSLVINDADLKDNNQNESYAVKSKVKTLEQRKEIWKTTIKMISDSPLVGVGSGNFHIVIPKYREPYDVNKESVIKWAHNDLLEIAAESGIPSAIIFLVIFITALCVFLKNRHLYGEYSVSLISLGASFVATFVHSQTSFNLYQAAPATIFFFSLAVICNFRRIDSRSVEPSIVIKRNDILVAVVFFLISLLFFIKPVLAELYYVKAAKASKEGNWQICMQNINESILYNNGEAKYFYTAALGSFRLTNYSDAVIFSKKAHTLTPNVPEVYKILTFSLNEIGNKHYKEGNPGKAIIYYRNSIEYFEKLFLLPLSKKNIKVFSKLTGITYYNLGNCLIKKGDFKEAVASYKTSLKYSPNYQPSILKLQELLS